MIELGPGADLFRMVGTFFWLLFLGALAAALLIPTNPIVNLADRALMLSGVVEANLRDTGSGQALHNEVFTTSLSYFEDKASGLSVREVNAFGVGSERQRYVFGDDNGNPLYGAGAGQIRIDGQAIGVSVVKLRDGSQIGRRAQRRRSGPCLRKVRFDAIALVQ